MKLSRLESGYWHARWSSEIWAQWPCHRSVRAEDFFHADYAFTRERAAECDAWTVAACPPEEK